MYEYRYKHWCAYVYAGRCIHIYLWGLYINELVQERRNVIANAPEFRLPCTSTNPTMYYMTYVNHYRCCLHCCTVLTAFVGHVSVGQHLGWGLLSQFPPFLYFPKFSALSKNAFAIEYHVYIWQVSPQLSCGGTCQIQMWFDNLRCTFDRSKILLTEKLTNETLVTPTPDQFSHLGPLLLTWFNFNPSMDK